jgi:hypothetical protein
MNVLCTCVLSVSATMHKCVNVCVCVCVCERERERERLLLSVCMFVCEGL